MTFRNPTNGYTVAAPHAFLWCLLFGFLYFLKHSAWSAAAIALVVALFTAGLAWFIYPFFAKGIIRKSYLSRGWIEGPAAAV